MHYRFPCSHCRKSLKATPEIAGKSVKCPACGERITVPPAPNAEPAAVTAAPASEAPVAESPKFEQTDYAAAAAVPGPATPSPSSRLIPQIETDRRTVKKVPTRRKPKKPAWLWIAASIAAMALVGMAAIAIPMMLNRIEVADTSNLSAAQSSLNQPAHTVEATSQPASNSAGGSDQATEANKPSPVRFEPAAPGSGIDKRTWNEFEKSLEKGRQKAEEEGAIVRTQTINGATVTTVDRPFPVVNNDETEKVNPAAKSPAQWLADVRDVKVSPVDRGKAMAALRKLGAAAVPAVTQAMYNPKSIREQNYLCGMMAWLLVKMTADGVPAARAELIQLMEDKERVDLRNRATTVMAQTGATHFVDFMAPYLTADDHQLRLAALHIVVRCGPSTTVKYAAQIASFLGEKQSYERNKAYDALRAAGQLAAADALPVLINLVDSPDREVTLNVVELMFNLGIEKYPELKPRAYEVMARKFAETPESDQELYLTLEIMVKRLKP